MASPKSFWDSIIRRRQPDRPAVANIHNLEGQNWRSNRFQYCDGVGRYYDRPLPKLNIALMEECWRFVTSRTPIPYTVETRAGVKQTLMRWSQMNWGTLKPYSVSQRRNEKGQFASGTYCGSTHCVAGYAAERTDNVAWVATGIGSYSAVLKEVIDTPEGQVRARDWWTAGAVLLGLTKWEAESLFNGLNTAWAIKVTMQAIADSRNEYIFLPD